MKKLLPVLLAVVVPGILFAQEDNYDTVRVTSQTLTDHVYLLKGSGGNIGVLTGSEGIVVVDDQFAPLTEKIRERIKTLDPSPVRFVINTHLHGDHSGGNENFKKAGATIVAHNNVRTRMSTGDRTRDKDAWPVVTFSTSTSLHLNGEDVDILYFGAGHTDGDVLIHFKKANVFHAGDLYVRYGYPYIDFTAGGSIDGFVSNLDKMIELMDDKSKVIPGHGELATKKDVQVFRDKIKDIRDQVAAALKKGKKPADITSLGITKKYEAEWGKGFLKGNDFVLQVAEDLGKK